jgi:hypothetical protein
MQPEGSTGVPPEPLSEADFDRFKRLAALNDDVVYEDDDPEAGIIEILLRLLAQIERRRAAQTVDVREVRRSEPVLEPVAEAKLEGLASLSDDVDEEDDENEVVTGPDLEYRRALDVEGERVFVVPPEVHEPAAPSDPDDPHGYRTPIEHLIDDLTTDWVMRDRDDDDPSSVVARVRGVINQAGDFLIQHEHREGTDWHDANVRVHLDDGNPEGFIIVELPGGDLLKRRRFLPRPGGDRLPD